MSAREKAIQLLDIIDDEKMIYVVGILENLTSFADIPNDETIAALNEGDAMLKSGKGQRFEGPTEELFKKILET